MRRGPALLGAAVLTLAVLAGLRALGNDGPGVAGANGVQPGLFVADVQPEHSICAAGETLPERASGVTVTAGSYELPTAHLEASVRQGSTTIARGSVTAPQGILTIPLAPAVRTSVPGVAVCLANRGRGRVAIAGVPTVDRNPLVTRDGRAVKARLSLLYRRNRDQSWLQLGGAIARRAGYANASRFGSGTLAAIALLVTGAVGLAGLMLLRRGAP